MKWLQVAFVAGLDLAASAAIAQLAPPWDRWGLFFVALGILWLLPAGLGVWSFVKFWIGYHLFIKRRLVRYFKARMYEANLPASGGFFDHMNYLSHVLDEDFERKAKNRASYFVGELTTYKESQPFTMGIASQAAFETAMEEYRPVEGNGFARR